MYIAMAEKRMLENSVDSISDFVLRISGQTK